MVFGLFKKVVAASGREVAAEYGKNKDFLEAVVAAAALVAYADGELEESERRKIVSLITNHSTLGKLYKSNDIESTVDTFFKRAKDSSGRQQLSRELDDVKGNPQFAEDVYLITLDIANSDGTLEPEEEKVLSKIAARLGVDPTRFEF